MSFPTRNHGTFRALLSRMIPSTHYLTRPGLFAVQSLPATGQYATRNQRMVIQDLGNRYGCHSCGAGSPLHRMFREIGLQKIQFRADHIPPNSMANRMKLEGTDVKQKLYPQYPKCAMKQCRLLSKQTALKK